MRVVSRRWVWVESMGVVSGCGCPYSLFIFKMFFVLVPVLFVS